MQTQNAESGDLTTKVESLATRLEKLRFTYEQYFMGMERIEPQQEKNTVKSMLNDLRKSHIRNTALRFRVNQLFARLNSYDTYWSRITRQIEEGTYHRDILKARKRMQAISNSESKNHAVTPPVSSPNLGEVKPTGITSQPQRVLSDQQMNKLYEAYTRARQSCGESMQGITKEAVAKSLQKQIPNIIQQYKCKSVSFKVTIKNGKAVIRAIPKS